MDTQSSHIDTDDLIAYVQGRIDLTEEAEAHLANCEECRKRHTVVGMGVVWALESKSLRAQASTPTRVIRWVGASLRQHRGSLALAAAVLVVFIGYRLGTRRGEEPEHPPSSPLAPPSARGGPTPGVLDHETRSEIDLVLKIVRGAASDGAIIDRAHDGQTLAPSDGLFFELRSRGEGQLLLLERDPSGLIKTLLQAQSGGIVRFPESNGTPLVWRPDGSEGTYTWLAILIPSEAPPEPDLDALFDRLVPESGNTLAPPASNLPFDVRRMRVEPADPSPPR